MPKVKCMPIKTLRKIRDNNYYATFIRTNGSQTEFNPEEIDAEILRKENNMRKQIKKFKELLGEQ